jgi:hypothetical protein
MAYDFTGLSPVDFEDLVSPDGGVDGRHAMGRGTIIMFASEALVGINLSCTQSEDETRARFDRSAVARALYPRDFPTSLAAEQARACKHYRPITR